MEYTPLDLVVVELLAHIIKLLMAVLEALVVVGRVMAQLIILQDLVKLVRQILVVALEELRMLLLAPLVALAS